MVELHKSISRIQVSAKHIEEMLQRISNAEKVKYAYQNYNYYVYELDNAFKDQLKQLEILKELLRDEETRLIIEIYDENIKEEPIYSAIHKLVGLKRSLIDVAIALFYSEDKYLLSIPKSFDLLDLPMLIDYIEYNKKEGYIDNKLTNKEAFEEHFKYGNYQKLLHHSFRNGIKLSKDFMDTIPKNVDGDNSEDEEVKKKKHLELLINYVIPLFEKTTNLKSSEKLLTIKNQLGNVIKSNFKIDEII